MLLKREWKLTVFPVPQRFSLNFIFQNQMCNFHWPVSPGLHWSFWRLQISVKPTKFFWRLSPPPISSGNSNRSWEHFTLGICNMTSAFFPEHRFNPLSMFAHRSYTESNTLPSRLSLIFLFSSIKRKAQKPKWSFSWGLFTFLFFGWPSKAIRSLGKSGDNVGKRQARKTVGKQRLPGLKY